LGCQARWIKRQVAPDLATGILIVPVSAKISIRTSGSGSLSAYLRIINFNIPDVTLDSLELTYALVQGVSFPPPGLVAISRVTDVKVSKDERVLLEAALHEGEVNAVLCSVPKKSRDAMLWWGGELPRELLLDLVLRFHQGKRRAVYKTRLESVPVTLSVPQSVWPTTD